MMPDGLFPHGLFPGGWRTGLLLALLLPVAGCAHHHPPAPPEDAALAQAAHSGSLSLSFGHPGQAVTQYRQALKLALARNDAQAIGDCGYDLAVAELADNKPVQSLATTLRTREALAARATPGFAELDLVQAAALHRLGRDPEADAFAARAQSTASDPETIARASYVRGLIAYGRNDAAGVGAALAGFGQPKQPSADWQADHDALNARLELLRGNNQQAAGLARQAADIERTRQDYNDMADALALAALATQRAGLPNDAADLYLQAGQSAAARGDRDMAIPWLRQAQMTGADLATQKTARDTLAGLRKS